MPGSLGASGCVLEGGGGGQADSGRVLAEQQLLRNARFTFQFRAALPRSPHACSPARLTGDTVLLDKSSCSRKTHPAIIFSYSAPPDDPYGGQSHTWLKGFSDWGGNGPRKAADINHWQQYALRPQRGACRCVAAFLFLPFHWSRLNASRRVANKQINKAAPSLVGGVVGGGIFFQSRAAPKLSQTSANT